MMQVQMTTPEERITILSTPASQSTDQQAVTPSALDSFVMRRMQHAARGRWQQKQQPVNDDKDAPISAESQNGEHQEINEVTDIRLQTKAPSEKAPQTAAPITRTVSRGRRARPSIVSASPPVSSSKLSSSQLHAPLNSSPNTGRHLHVGPRHPSAPSTNKHQKATFKDILDDDWLGADSDDEDNDDCLFYPKTKTSVATSPTALLMARMMDNSSGRSVSSSPTRRMKVQAYAA